MVLTDFGFAEVGVWKLYSAVNSGISFTLMGMKDARVIYSFVVGDDVKYIGVCDNTRTTLTDRMGRYKNMQGAGTNERIAKRIGESLNKGIPVRIFGLSPESAVQYRVLSIDLIKGLEHPLIRFFSPEWNIQG